MARIKATVNRQKCRLILRKLALSIHESGHIHHLATEIHRNKNTVYKWITAGRVPRTAALYLEEKYGKVRAPSAVLNWS